MEKKFQEMDVLMYDELRTLDKKLHMTLLVDPIVKYDNLLFAISSKKQKQLIQLLVLV